MDPANGLSAAADEAVGSSVPRSQYFCKDFYKVVKFYEEGSDSINEHKVALEQWKPSWSNTPTTKQGETA